MTSSMLRRQLKNLVQNYSEAEVKVREATSNDPWGPSSSQMADLSDLTYNVVACNEIMTMLWKRLKDDRNWRHIHKSLTLLEYLLKTGDDRVLLKMKDNVYIVKALTEYRFIEKDGKDQGGNVREKAKVVLVLMEDDEKLKEERDFAFKTREKTSKGAAASSTDALKDPNYKPCFVAGASGLPCLDNIPSVADLTASFAARKEERLRQETEKKEEERRAKLSEDELKWEDAGKPGEFKGENKVEEEKKADPWGAPKEATGPWGTPESPDATDTAERSDPWGAPTKNDKDSKQAEEMDQDPFVASKTEKDPFNAPKDDPFNAPKDDPFNAPKDDPFNAPKDDPFNAPKDDPFNAPKDDPFNAPKDDPFNAPMDDPFNAPKDDPFNAPKDDPFNAPKDDPFNAPKDDPFNAPKDDPFNAPKDDPFNAPKDDPFNAPQDDPFNAPQDDPFNAPKDDPFNAPKDDPFNAPKDSVSASTPPKEASPDPEVSKDYAFEAPSTPPKEVPICSTTKPLFSPLADVEPFGAPFVADPFTAPTSPPKETPSDAFNALSASSPPASADTWGSTFPPQEAKRDPWGNGASANSPVNSSDPFGDSSITNDDPWGAPASPLAASDDAWGAPAPPLGSSPLDDPFGDGASKSKDPWGAPSNLTGNGTASLQLTVFINLFFRFAFSLSFSSFSTRPTKENTF
uniref:Epsin-1-like n=1 Tax=Gouania willdenowi TaxID=441366 RepID=A0A8C5DQ62_GOUWI